MRIDNVRFRAVLCGETYDRETVESMGDLNMFAITAGSTKCSCRYTLVMRMGGNTACFGDQTQPFTRAGKLRTRCPRRHQPNTFIYRRSGYDYLRSHCI